MSESNKPTDQHPQCDDGLSSQQTSLPESISSQDLSVPGHVPEPDSDPTAVADYDEPPPDWERWIPEPIDIDAMSNEEYGEITGLAAATEPLEPEHIDMEELYPVPEEPAASLERRNLPPRENADSCPEATPIPAQDLKRSDRVRWNKDWNQPELPGQIRAGDAASLQQACDVPSRQYLSAIASVHPGPAFGETQVGHGGWLIKTSTAKQYEKHSYSLWWAAARSFSNDEEVQWNMPPTFVAQFLIRKVAGIYGKRPLSKASWFAYRSSLIWLFSPRAHDPAYADAIRMLGEFTYPEHTVTEDGDGAYTKGSRKAIPLRDLKKIIDQLSLSRSSIALSLQCWLIAGIQTGLRPSEWEHAVWENADRSILLAPNSKLHADLSVVERTSPTKVHASATQGSAPEIKPARPGQLPPVRLRMRAIPIDPSMRPWVGLHMELVKAAKDSGVSFDRYYGLARKMLWRTCKQIWGDSKTYSLYQCRHQFSANSKAVLNLDEVAAQMGHSSRTTTRQHYASAKESHVKGGQKPKRRMSSGELPQIVLALRAGLHNMQSEGDEVEGESSAARPRTTSS